MKPDDLDRKLQRLREAGERIAANLVELEVDSNRQLVEASALEGESAARWSATSASITELWRRHGLLESVLERAGKLRGGWRSGDLRALLEGPSIELSNSEVPLADRDLLGSLEVAERCSPDQLLVNMSRAFDEVKTVVSGIGAAWETLIPRLDAARRLLVETTQLAQSLGDPAGSDLESATRTLSALSAALTTDPLSVAPGDIEALVRALEVIRGDLDSIAALGREFDARIASARELLERLRTAVLEGQAAHEEVVVKISVPAAPSALRLPEDLDAQLSEIATLAQRGSWRDAHRSLEQWSARTSVLLDDAQRILHANRAPIEARNQFRGLLEAYQFKAKRLGVVEDPDLADIFAQAHQALYNAPTDLALVGQLVRRYQETLSGSEPTSEAML
jgi:hypothetical protein